MIVGIDGKPLTSSVPGGLREYAEQLLRHIVASDRHNTYIVYLPKPSAFVPASPNLRTVTAPPGPWQLLLPQLVKQQPCDVLHFLHQHGSVFVRHPRIVTTVHDLADLRAFPTFFENPYFSLLGAYIQCIRHPIIRHSRTLIAVSEYTKREVSRVYHGRKCTVVSEGCDAVFRPQTNRVNPRHVLVLSDFSPRKNTVRAVRAYAELPLFLRRRYPLVLVLSMPFMKEKFFQLAKTCGIKTNIRVILCPDKKTLARLYRESVVFLYPSLYEGFGLPIVEAMASGAPVITSFRGAMRETAGNAAHLVDPESVVSIARGMEKIMTDRSYRVTLSDRGITRAKRYSWRRAAQETIRIYEQTYQQAI